MDRRSEILKHVTKTQHGIEVGPWFAPLAPKREGFNCLSLDVFDTDTLRATAWRDPNVPKDRIEFIESVDIIGTSTNIEAVIAERGLLGKFDYVISSHNFEHLPNPIKFLRGCGNVLKIGGYLSMALPDKRTCFDYFRPHTTLGGWIEAFLDDRDSPTFTQVFDQNSLHSRYRVGDEQRTGFSLNDDPSNVIALRTLREAYDTWVSRKASGDRSYYDAHCWMFTPSSFRQLVSDTEFLGLSPFSIEKISESNGNEFYVHLRNTGYKLYSEEQIQAHYDGRQSLLHKIECEAGQHSIDGFRMRKELAYADQDSALLSDIFAKLGVSNGDVAGACEKIGSLYRQREQDRRMIAEVERRIQDLDNFACEQHKRIVDLHDSTSWRLTAPLRSIKRVMKKLAL